MHHEEQGFVKYSRLSFVPEEALSFPRSIAFCTRLLSASPCLMRCTSQVANTYCSDPRFWTACDSMWQRSKRCIQSRMGCNASNYIHSVCLVLSRAGAARVEYHNSLLLLPQHLDLPTHLGRRLPDPREHSIAATRDRNAHANSLGAFRSRNVRQQPFPRIQIEREHDLQLVKRVSHNSQITISVLRVLCTLVVVKSCEWSSIEQDKLARRPISSPCQLLAAT